MISYQVISWFQILPLKFNLHRCNKAPIPSDASFRQIIVPTVDTVRYLFLAGLS